ncbi:MAG: glycoside hydrolase family 3 C-terminal domain-containing protein [Eggerthellaceae bacterium]|nr:glycoside hydrolase family 3 C-terminal domain-containing protein [Eggerthellaceae bacterium]MCH4221686.1 glycoside hydrolase family 3 C-terminal domain-containing protein [Eggerthellaceae bacterium]
MNGHIREHMTLREKCRMLAGADGWRGVGCERLGIAPLVFADGPHGLRKQTTGADCLGFGSSIPGTCFPTASAVACSFDRQLLYEIGCALGEECRAEDVSVLLGPGVNMKRSPLCGRNFEYLSEDPYLAGHLAAADIAGIQSKGVGCALKHFMGNSQEKARMSSDSVIDGRTMREIYLRAFEIAVKKSQPWFVMTAYNRVNGVYCSQNAPLIRDILRNEWGFDGATVTDWEALSGILDSLPAGLDLVMPGPRPDYTDSIYVAVQHHVITQCELDEAVGHLLAVSNRRDQGLKSSVACDYDAHLRLAQRAACESSVLLENDGVLPLDRSDSVAIIGSFALTPRYQGTGSSRINPRDLDCFYDAFMDDYEHGSVLYASGYDAHTGTTTDHQMEVACDCARQCATVVLFAGLPDGYESEGFDRRTLRLPPDLEKLISAVCAVNKRVVVVLQGGAPIEMSWRDKPAAILMMYLAGARNGHAAADLLTGRVSPSGKLAETWPLSLQDTPTAGRFPSTEREILYTEGPYIGYRYYDTAHIPVAYPFGFGRSYTSFSYADLAIKGDGTNALGVSAKSTDAASNQTESAVSAGEVSAQGEEYKGSDRSVDGPIVMRVSCSIANTGIVAGDEIVQLYVAPRCGGVFREEQTLQGFERVHLEAEQSKTISFNLTRRSFAHYDVDRKAWCVEQGPYEIRVAASSRDIRLRTSVDISGDSIRADHMPDCYHHPFKGCFENKDAASSFALLYRRAFPRLIPTRPFTMDSTLSQTRETVLGKICLPIVGRLLTDAVGGDGKAQSVFGEMINDMPIRSVHMRGWRMSSIQIGVDFLNHHFCRGVLLWHERNKIAKQRQSNQDNGEASEAANNITSK